MDDRFLYAGLIRLHLLHHAAQGPIYGLAMIEELGRHGYKLSAGTLYPILHGLEEKGYVTHTIQGRTFLYRAADTKRDVAVGLVAQLVDTFCGGSMEELLVGLVDNQVVKPAQLRRLAKKIAARKEKRS